VIHPGSWASASSPSLAGLRLVQPHLRQARLHRLAQQPVLGHREGVAGRQRQDELVRMEGTHRPGF
jgi:hypothetical protein